VVGVSGRHAEIRVLNRHCAQVRGYGTRAALIEVTGRSPVYSTRSRAWVVSEATAVKLLLPHLEYHGYDVTLLGPEDDES
jgi:hypothetical protein